MSPTCVSINFSIRYLFLIYQQCEQSSKLLAQSFQITPETHLKYHIDMHHEVQRNM